MGDTERAGAGIFCFLACFVGKDNTMTEWNAIDYNRISTLQEVMAEEEIRRLQLTGAERVLDVGCGDGKVTARIAGLVPRGSVLGVDPSRNMIDYASRHFGSAGANLRFAVADARSMPYRSEFDLVVSFNALHWVAEQEDALRCIQAALKPGGRALLRFVPRENGRAIEYTIEEVRSRSRWAGFFPGFRPPFAHFTPEQYRGMAERSGLVVDHIRVEDGSWDFKSREAFVAFCSATFVEWTRLLPEADRPAFIADVLDHFRASVCPRPGEENIFKFQQMEVALTKPAAHQ
jgi:ubiquinone/menaquinone biosynthesis C-methylase UbiE